MPVGMPPINWAELASKAQEDNTFVNLDAGNYNFIITKVEPTKQTRNGKLKFSMTFMVADGPKKNSRAFYNQTFGDTTSPIGTQVLMRDLSFFGLDGQFFANHPNPTQEDFEAALIRQKFNADLSYRDGQWSEFAFQKRLGMADVASNGPAIPQVAAATPQVTTPAVAATPAPAAAAAAAAVEDTPAPAVTPAMAMPPLPPLA